MKRKLIVTLVASALELLATTSGAQTAPAGSCFLPNGQTATSVATGVLSGPMSPVSGFPEYVTDFGRNPTTNLPFSVQRCTDPALCFFDPVVPTDPLSVQIGTGGEAFYWSADAIVSNAAGDRILTAVYAAETAFLQTGPNGELVDGSQFPFLRMRYVMGVPVDGTYTVLHPWGAQQFTVTGATGARDVFSTIDSGLTPGQVTSGPVGPMLYQPDFLRGNGTFMGDVNIADIVEGGPCRNEVILSGVGTDGLPVDFGNGETIVSSQLFTVQGMLWDGKVQTPLVPTRATYSRDALSTQIEGFAQSTASANVLLSNGDTVASSGLVGSVALDREAIGGTGLNSTTVQIGAAGVLPPLVKMTASETTGVTDATGVNTALVDFVDVAQADYDPATKKLTIMASSGDQVNPPALTARDYGTLTNGLLVIDTVAPPAIVYVDSAAGGHASARVRVIAALPPVAPSDVVATARTARTLTLSWADQSTNESGFRITLTPVAGGTALVFTAGSNATSLPVTGLTPATAYTVLVEAINGIGAAAAPTIEVSTLALPVAPTAVGGALAASPTSRGIVVSFSDNSDDETAFEIQRSTLAGGTYVTVGTMTVAAPASTGVISYTDTAGLNTSATYFYKVVAVRGVDKSTASAASTGVATPAAPTANAAPTFGTRTTSSVVVNWTRRNTTETGYIVYRAPVNGTTVGTFTPVSATLSPTGTSTSTQTFTDNSAAPGTTYQYRINAVGWANYTTGINGATANTSTPEVLNLQAPTNLTASTATRPVVRWTDNSTGETAYRVSRTSVSVAANGALLASNVTLPVSSAITTAAGTGGTLSFTDTAIQSNTVRYDVAALSGTTPGPVGLVYTVIGGLPDANRPTATAVNGVARVNLAWTALGVNAVGGYEIQRCVAAGATGANATTCQSGTSFEKVPGTAVNSAGTVDGRSTAAFADITVARNTNYVYRMRTVGGAGTGLVGANFSATRGVSTN